MNGFEHTFSYGVSVPKKMVMKWDRLATELGPPPAISFPIEIIASEGVSEFKEEVRLKKWIQRAGTHKQRVKTKQITRKIKTGLFLMDQSLFGKNPVLVGHPNTVSEFVKQIKQQQSTGGSCS